MNVMIVCEENLIGSLKVYQLYYPVNHLHTDMQLTNNKIFDSYSRESLNIHFRVLLKQIQAVPAQMPWKAE